MRGGAREGAGRKPSEVPRKMRSFRLTDQEYEQVKQYVVKLKEKTKAK